MKIFFVWIIVLLRFVSSSFFDDECDIPIQERIRVGEANITEGQCTQDRFQSLNCFQSGYGCFKPKYAIPGFTYKDGVLRGWDTLGEIHDSKAQDPKICALYCLKYPNCFGFTISNTPHPPNTNKYCFPKGSAFFKGSYLPHLPSQMRSFDRYSFFETTCQTGVCSQSGNDEGNKNLIYCKIVCDGNSDCNYFTIATSSCSTNNQCTLTSNVGDKVTCSKEPARTLSIVYDKSAISTLADNNNSTCVDIVTTPFVIRYPFPSVNKALGPVKLDVIGIELNCNQLISGNMLVYVPSKPEFDIKFTGIFKKCDLLSSTKTKCEFSCSCDERHCEGVYIRAYSNLNPGLLKLCEIKFLG